MSGAVAGLVLRVAVLALAWAGVTYAGLLLGLQALDSGNKAAMILCGGFLFVSLLLLAAVWRLFGQGLE